MTKTIHLILICLIVGSQLSAAVGFIWEIVFYMSWCLLIYVRGLRLLLKFWWCSVFSLQRCMVGRLTMRSIGTCFMRRRYFIENSNILYLLTNNSTDILLIFILWIRFWFLFFSLCIINLWVFIGNRSLILLTRLFFTKTWNRCVNLRARSWCISAFRFFKFIRVVLLFFVTLSFEDCICLLIAWYLLGFSLGSISTRIWWNSYLFPLRICIYLIASVSDWITWQRIIVCMGCITFCFLSLREVISLALWKIRILSILFLFYQLFLFKHCNWLLLLWGIFWGHLAIKALICLNFHNLFFLAFFSYYDVKPSIFRTLTFLLVKVLILFQF